MAAPRRRASLIVMVLLAGTVIRLLFAALIPLFPDEAYYWEWSRHLAPGYFDHPPVIALLIRAGTAVFGASAFGVRFFPVLAGLAAGALTAGIAWRLAGYRAALVAALAITALPLAAAGLVLATPDAPLLATTALTLYAAVRALESDSGSRRSLAWWCAAGCGLGLAFSSKYTSILLPVGATIAFVWRSGLRARLREPGPYVACLVATLVFTPVLVWNASHEWVSFGFQLRHGLAAPRPDLLAPLKRLGDLIGGQAGLVSPILFVMMVIATIRSLRRSVSDMIFMLGVIAAFTFLFFCASATRQRVEANWPAPAYIPSIALLSAMDWSRRAAAWRRAGVWFSAGLSMVIYLHAGFGLLPLAPRRDPVARAAGWSLLGTRAFAVVRTTEAATGSRVWLGADRYQDAAELAFYTRGHPRVFSLNLYGRRNQYDLWRLFPEQASTGDALVLALDERDGTHDTIVRLRDFFAEARRDTLVLLRNRRGVVAQRRLWVLTSWTGGWPSADEGR